MHTNTELIPGKNPKPLGPGAQRVHAILTIRGPLDAEGIAKSLSPLIKNVSEVRSRLAELRARKLVVTEVVIESGRKVHVHRAVGGLPASANEHVDVQTPARGGATAISVSSAVSQNRVDLSYLDQEEAFIDRLFPQPRTVEIEKVNQAWLVRFLPVCLGDRKLWYMRLGQHRMNERSLYCPRRVSPDFGGNPDADCPVCEMADILSAEQNDDISNFGLTVRANLAYLTYCLVYQIDPGRGETQEMPEREIVKPWAFYHEHGGFRELMDYFRRGATPDRPSSVLDLKKGNDFWATRTTKGICLDRQDSSPILATSDPNYNARIAQVLNAISQPKIKIPTLKELETFAHKAEAAAGKIGSDSHGALTQ